MIRLVVDIETLGAPVMGRKAAMSPMFAFSYGQRSPVVIHCTPPDDWDIFQVDLAFIVYTGANNDWYRRLPR